MLRIHFSNRTEVLAQRLIDTIGRSGDVFSADQVLVPHTGMQRWLTLAIARQHGICAQVQFGYLAPWLWQQVARRVPGAPAARPPDNAVLAWRIHQRLGDAGFVASQPRLAAHLQHSDAVMRLELAQRVAQLLDSYATYRPDWLQRWCAGQRVDLPGDTADDQAWQAALCQQLQTDTALPLLEALAAQPGPAGPPQAAPVHVFLPTTLAPLHRALLGELARFVDIELYLLNPCQEYWFDITDPRRLARLAARRQEQGHDVGHRLLAAWGRQTQSQLGALLDGWPQAAIEDEQFEANPADSLLARLQNSILDLAHLPAGIWRDLPADDRSLEVHCCHSLTRELEVLHDRLLAAFVQTPALQPSDVLVVLPDLEAAAPLIDAVFGTVGANRHIPYTISGRASSRENAAARALLDLLALLSGRLPASELFGWMQQPLVAQRFGWSDDDLTRLHELLLASGLRWGLDGAHRQRLGLPIGERHTLADAMERLFLGHALPDAVDAPFAGILPAAGLEGSQAQLLGSLWQLVQQLQQLGQAWQQPQAATAAVALMRGAVDALLQARPDTPGDIDDLQQLLRALAELQRAAEAGSGGEALPLALWRHALEQQLDTPARGGVPTGRVTFTAMNSLRGVPFAVVCVLGLDDGSFPGRSRPHEFDLMQHQRRLGDRQRADDDRNLFLDLLMAARQTLVLSYTGRSVRDNAVLPPSVLVADLLDLLLPALDQPRSRLVIEHPLQPFSPQAFDNRGDPRLRSFNHELVQALRQAAAPARQALPPARIDNVLDDTLGDDDVEDDGDSEDDLAGATAQRQRFFTAALPAPGPAWREVALQQLQRFLRNPCRTWLRRRLRLALQREASVLADDEPLTAGRDEQRALARRLLPALLRGLPREQLVALAAAGTELPAGPVGSAEVDQQLQRLQPLAERFRAAAPGALLPPHSMALTFTIDGEPWQLRASLTDLRPEGLVRWALAKTGAGTLLDAWLHHLLLCASPAPGAQAATRWITLDGEIRFAAVADPLAPLHTLMALYRRGLCEPLPFFPRAAWALAGEAGNLQAAETTWSAPGREEAGERNDPAYALALRGWPAPLAGEFSALAQAVFQPLREHLLQEPAP